MITKKHVLPSGAFLTMATLMSGTASAHDPVFGVGPHVLYKGGYELHLGVHREESNERETESEFEFKYGITGDWVAGLGTGYARTDGRADSESGRAPTTLFTKYRFWRKDTFGAQESAAVIGKVIFDDGETGHQGEAEPAGNDYLAGLTYGFEGRKWYRWASIRHRFNSETAAGAERPDRTLVDLVVGIRPTPTEYLSPDWVWMLELNGEFIERVSRGTGSAEKQLGGNQWFLSPGLMWTYRNVAFKVGVQLPIVDDLSPDLRQDDYLALMELEWHF